MRGKSSNPHPRFVDNDNNLPRTKFEASENQVKIKSEGLLEEVLTRNLPAFLQGFCNRNKAQAPYKVSFKTRAYDLFMSRYNGEQNQRFAEAQGVSNSTVSQWMAKLKKLVGDYFSGSFSEIAKY